MAVIRVEKNKNYTVMSNVHLRDKALSLKAKGLAKSQEQARKQQRERVKEKQKDRGQEL